MPRCKLCGKDKELRNSHIIPESLWIDLYNTKHQIMGINGAGNRHWKALQKGVREPLFCECCEQHFNEYFEKPFKAQWLDRAQLPHLLRADAAYRVSVDYSTFKLFHLSVLFRAGVSTLPTFASVALGPHEERLRLMLKSRMAGTVSEYPLFGFAVIHHKTGALVPLVSQAIRSAFFGHRCYGIIYGGVQWWFSVSSHRNQEFERIGLQADGSMPLLAVPWNEVGIVQSASEALRVGWSGL